MNPHPLPHRCPPPAAATASEALIKSRHCLCSCVYFLSEISLRVLPLRLIFSRISRLAPYTAPQPLSCRLRGVGGHSKRLLTRFKVSFIVPRNRPLWCDDWGGGTPALLPPETVTKEEAPPFFFLERGSSGYESQMWNKR